MVNKSDIASAERIKAALDGAIKDCKARLESEQTNLENAVKEILKEFIERERDIRLKGPGVNYDEAIRESYEKANGHDQKVSDLERELETLHRMAERPGDIATAIMRFSPPGQP